MTPTESHLGKGRAWRAPHTPSTQHTVVRVPADLSVEINKLCDIYQFKNSCGDAGDPE